LCHKNGYRFSITTGTIFQDKKLPLKAWFKVAYLMLSSKKGERLAASSHDALERRWGLPDFLVYVPSLARRDEEHAMGLADGRG
jgi:hypothetical protein